MGEVGSFSSSVVYFSGKRVLTYTSRENVFESNLCSLYTSLPLDDTDVNVDDRGT
jgi:hypothetical protein